MRSYHKLYLNETLDSVTSKPDGSHTRAIALQYPGSKAQMIAAFNLLGAAYVPRDDFGGAVWKLYSASGTLIVTFSGPQLANDVFSFVDYANHPLN